MCGIAGIVSSVPSDPMRGEIVHRMARTLAHRGPDGEGFAHLDGCDLGFRRLAIVDVDAPAEPFSNEDGAVQTICNGEIYNGDELRRWLLARGHRLRTEVDTEILPHLYEEAGPDFVERLDGMFAFALYDARRRLLVAGRDRAGEKPLFYWTSGDEIVFASELRAFLEHPRTPRALDPVALRRYLLHDFFPAPRTPIAGIRKLPAAHVLVHHGGRTEVRSYWDLADVYARPPAVTSLEEAARELDARIGEAVFRRKRSHVPVGVFLSGGIDSSAILAHLAEQEGGGVPVFSLGHRDLAFDESRFARQTARHFGADLEELILDERDLEEGLRRVAEGLDEPLGDASTIPTHLLSLHARRKVKVVLSGEGADELFAGYPTYVGDGLAERWRKVPGPIRRALAGAAGRLVPVTMGNVGLDYLFQRFGQAFERERLERHTCWFGGLPPERHAEVLAPRVLAGLERDDPFGAVRERLLGRTLRDPLSTLLYMDFALYLQDDLLTKVDRASMLASLEARAPFLDHDLAEYAAGLPSSFKVRRTTTKVVLRRAMANRLPAEILRRRKRGFNIPFSRWLLGGLGKRLRVRFARERVEARGLLSPEGVRSLLDEHLARRADHRKPLFSLLALDLWCDRTFGEGAAVPIADETRVATTPLAGAR